MGKPGPLYTAQGWSQALRCPEFIAYLAVSRPPLQGSRDEIVAAQRTLWATPLIRDILQSQHRAGDWPAYLPGRTQRLWFRQPPLPLIVLCEAGFTLDQEPVRRASRHLLSTLEDGVFRNPWREIDEPDEYHELYNAHCLEAVARCGFAGHARVQRAVEVALGRQRWDGGWGVRPSWRPFPNEEAGGREPSCEVCTAAMIRALGHVPGLPAAAVERMMGYRLDERWEAPSGWWIPDLLLQLDCLARQGRRLDDPHVRRLLQKLERARDEEGSFLPYEGCKGCYPPEYTELIYSHLRWWLGDQWS